MVVEKNKKFDIAKFTLLIFLAVFSTMFFHELGHYLFGTVLGNKMEMDLNGTRPVSGGFLKSSHLPIILFGGPLFTLIQAFVALTLIIKLNKKWLYPFVLIQGLYRVGLYITLVFFSNRLIYQDEARLGEYFGLNPWIIPVLLCLTLTSIIWWSSRELKIKLKYNLITLITGIFFFILLFKINQMIFL